MFIYNCSARYIMYYSFYIFVLQGSGLVNELLFYARRLGHPGSTKGSSSIWSHHLAVGLLRRSTGRTAKFMDFVANQLVELFGVHFYSALTSPPTSWLSYSMLDSSPTNWSDYPSLHRQLCWGHASYAGDSSVFGFFVQEPGSSSRWSGHLVLGLLRRSTGRTAGFMDFVTD